MKNYALSEEKEASFVLRYKLCGENLVIEYADGDSNILPYSLENEKELLRIMKRQVLDADEVIESANGVCRLVKTFSIIILVGTILTMFYYVWPVASSITDILVVELSGLLFISPSFILLKKIIKEKEELVRDIRKNQLFVCNELLFQDEITKGIELDSNIKEETKKVINSIIEEKERNNTDIVKPTINDIDKISYDTFMEMYDILNAKKKLRVLRKDNS